MVWGEEPGGGFALVEHPLPAKHLAAPLHRGRVSFVLEGRLGALLGHEVVYAEVVYAEVGDLVSSRAISGTPSGTTANPRVAWKSSRRL